MGSTSCRWMHLAAWLKAHFWLIMYSVGRHSRRSNRNRTGKPYAAHLARLDYLLIYLPTQVQLTLTKIIKILATRWRILRLKCTKFDFGWGSAPNPDGGAYSAPYLDLGGAGALLIRGGEERERVGRGEGKEGRGKESSMSPPSIWRKFTHMCVGRTAARLYYVYTSVWKCMPSEIVHRVLTI